MWNVGSRCAFTIQHWTVHNMPLQHPQNFPEPIWCELQSFQIRNFSLTLLLSLQQQNHSCLSKITTRMICLFLLTQVWETCTLLKKSRNDIIFTCTVVQNKLKAIPYYFGLTMSPAYDHVLWNICINSNVIRHNHNDQKC